MTHEKIKKFESKERLEELSPIETLKKAGFKEGLTLCDIGAGTGVFAIPASKISNENIYALEKSEDMIEILNNRTKEKKLKNLKVKKVKSTTLPMLDNTCDLVIMVTVLHHIDDKKTMVSEIKRILKEKGKLMIIEFHKRDTSMGPPIEIKISKEELEEFARDNELKIVDKFDLGDNFYGYVFEA
ncbi:MAG: class I SAM-dependent methyltransferase [Tissierella sp.]|uniref:class I SAM-dependent methyltransferase n=1 Tax=Tissierella sp. TaxID=41274 RepID=UPI003F9A05CC